MTYARADERTGGGVQIVEASQSCISEITVTVRLYLLRALATRRAQQRREEGTRNMRERK